MWKCGCARPECDAPPPSTILLFTLDLVRENYGRPLGVTSGPRCWWYNEQPTVKGDPNSEHPFGDGADLGCTRSRDRYDLIRSAYLAGVSRLGVGPTFIHIGVSMRPNHPEKVTWTYYPRGAK